ncbi:MAG: hypothetical protein JXN64_05780 [Spirochaetes bacterium]|nr:hypothetical protein [Spirochaetota bacterium]
MPSRNNAMIRRDINRLADLISEKGNAVPALEVLSGPVKEAAGQVNSAWKEYQSVSVAGDKEREERDSAVERLVDWIQHWRPVLFVMVPGADKNIKTLPRNGGTTDDVVRIAEDMVDFMKAEPGAASFAEKAMADLGDRLEKAARENREAVEVLSKEQGARFGFSEACIKANEVLVHSLNVVRSAFGPTSSEYKQFIARSSDSGGEAEDETVPAVPET